MPLKIDDRPTVRVSKDLKENLDIIRESTGMPIEYQVRLAIQETFLTKKGKIRKDLLRLNKTKSIAKIIAIKREKKRQRIIHQGKN